MRNKNERRSLHITKLPTKRKKIDSSKGVNTENIVTSNVGKQGKKTFKRINDGGIDYYVELKTIKE